MPTATYIPLANTTLPTNSATVTFSSIPNIYRDLVLVIDGKSVSSESYYYTYFNTDAGANYTRVELYGVNTGTGLSGTSSNLIPITLNSTNKCNHIMNIMDYSATDKHKTVLYRNNQIGLNAQVLAGAGRWASNTAINEIKLQGYLTAQFASGTMISLYGIVS